MQVLAREQTINTWILITDYVKNLGTFKPYFIITGLAVMTARKKVLSCNCGDRTFLGEEYFWDGLTCF